MTSPLTTVTIVTSTGREVELATHCCICDACIEVKTSMTSFPFMAQWYKAQAPSTNVVCFHGRQLCNMHKLITINEI